MNEILVMDMINLLGLNDLPLLEKFESNKLPILLVLGHFYLSKSTFDRQMRIPLPKVLPIS